jgi:hypothetical protein
VPKVFVEMYLRPPLEDQLFEVLREAGYEPRRGERHEERSVEAIELVLRVVDDIGREAALLLLGVAASWVRRRMSARAAARGARVRVLYGPDGDVAREVTIDEPDEA